MEEKGQKLKILYLITKSNFGGAQRYVFDLATYAQKLGHKVVVGFGGSGVLKEKLTEAGIHTAEIATLTRDVKFLADLKGFLRLYTLIHTEKPDVVHLNSSKMGAMGALAARFHNGTIHAKNIFGKKSSPSRIIFTGHGWAFTEDRPDWQRALIAFAHWLTIMLAHETIAVSEKTKEEVSRIPFTINKLTVIHNGTGDITTLSKKDALTHIFGNEAEELLSSDTIIIGTIGELHKNKGHSYALEALAQLKKQNKFLFKFIIIGDGEERGKLESMRESLGLTQEVIFHSNSNGRTVLSAFDIFLFPSIKEGFPYAILEAGNVGLPVIATAVGGIPEVIDDMKSGILIQSKNSGEITRALAYLMENKERRDEFGKVIHERIIGKFNLETMTKATLALYSK